MRKTFIPIFASTLFGLSAFGDIITTKDDEMFNGQVHAQTNKIIRFGTKYGELIFPEAEVKKHVRETYLIERDGKSSAIGKIMGRTERTLIVSEGESTRQIPLKTIVKISVYEQAEEASEPDRMTDREMMEEHAKGLKLFQEEKYQEVIEIYEKIHKFRPEDHIALYNIACAWSRLNDMEKSLEYLRKAVENGFADFGHIERDPDLEEVRKTDGYQELLKDKAELTKKATVKSIEWIGTQLKRKSIDPDKYETFYDAKRNFVYLHTKSAADFQKIREKMERYAEYQWEHLFPNKPGSPVYIVLLARQDSMKVLGPAKGGVFNPGSNILFCGYMPGNKLTQSSVVIHEFTHALHFADQAVRKQGHPIWFVEGLASLFETTRTVDSRIVPKHSYRLGIVQEAIRSGRVVPWLDLMKMPQGIFLRNPDITYSQARYMLHYMNEMGLLKQFYDEYTAGAGYSEDRTAADSYEIVFGKPLASVERDWQEWILDQEVPPIPFLGIAMAERDGKVVVNDVVKNTSAADIGIRRNDKILSIDGAVVVTNDEVIEAIRAREVGDEVTVEVERGGEILALNADLRPRPEVERNTTRRRFSRPSYLGLSVEAVDEVIRIRDVDEDSPAAKAGLKAGMELLEFDGTELKTVRDYLDRMARTRPDEEVKLKIRKTGDAEPEVLEVKIDELPRVR